MDPPGLAPLMEVLDHGRDGDPRWVVSDARNAAQAAAMARRAAASGRARGFVPMLVPLYLRFRDALADDLRQRALLLIGPLSSAVAESREALVDAAARSQRPHVLLTFRSAQTSGGTQVREARSAYGDEMTRDVSPPVEYSPEVARHILRAERATGFARSGRHAAAGRLLRDVAASLARRSAHVPAAQTLIVLGRLLLERGHAGTADEVFAQSIVLAELGRHEPSVIDGRIWQALARTDDGRVTEAESICRAVVLVAGRFAGRLAWARAVLARVLLWTNRMEEAGQLDLGVPPGPKDPAYGAGEDSPYGSGGALDEIVAACVHATAVRVFLATGRAFEAGQRARELLRTADGASDPLVRLIARVSHLRVLAAGGDLELAGEALGQVLDLARTARAPLRSARARLIWLEALRRAGRDREAQREMKMLGRIARGAPLLLRRAITQRLAHTDERPRGRPRDTRLPQGVPSIVPLVRIAHEVESDKDAVQRVVEWIAGELRTSRVDVVSADGGPVSTLISVGSGLPTRLGSRVLDAGIRLPAEVQSGGREIGIPVRLGSRLLAAVICRWPLDREPPPAAADITELAAAIAAPRLDALLASARETARASMAIPDLVGVSAAMADVRRAIERAATAPFAVLVEGESGVGKELVARAVHQLSPRRERRFCDVNCAALPDELLESELFGHARGAFTGAVADRPGLFEDASEGTIFLDELPDLSPRGQAKLLRVLQQHEVRRIGETFSRKIDVRLVTATNRDMKAEVADGRFRQDLLYRLDVIRIRIPPLRERPEDVAVLAEHFWTDAARRVGSTARLTHAVLAALSRYHWPGNVRELQNVMAALAVAAPARGRVQAALLPAAITGTTSVTSRRLAEARAQFEHRCVEVALARAGGSRTRAASELGLSRQGLLKTMARLGMLEPAEQDDAK